MANSRKASEDDMPPLYPKPILTYV
jgi:hypothetical protein